MRINTTFLTICTLVFALSVNVFLANAAFNERVTGARALAMGGAYTAVADDATACYWNPAGLYELKRHEVLVMYADKYNMTVGPTYSDQSFYYASPVTNYGSFGFHYNKEGSDSVLSEKSMGLSWSRKVWDKFSFGASLNSLTLSPATNDTQRSTNDPAMSDQSSLGFDLGFMLEIHKKAKLGMSVKNLGASFGNIVEHDLDTMLKFGAQVHPIDRLVVALDMNFKENIDENKDNSLQLNLGGEYYLTDQFAFRAGVNKGDLTAGMGFMADDWNIDYAFLSHDIGSTHKVSFSMRFGDFPETEEDAWMGSDKDEIADEFKAQTDEKYAASKMGSKLKTGQALPYFKGSEVASKKGRIELVNDARKRENAKSRKVRARASDRIMAALSDVKIKRGEVDRNAKITVQPTSSGTAKKSNDDIDDLFGDDKKSNDDIDDLFGDSSGTESTSKVSSSESGDDIDDLFGDSSNGSNSNQSSSKTKSAVTSRSNMGLDLASWKPLPKKVVYSKKSINPKKIPDPMKKFIDDQLYVSIEYLAEKLKYHYSTDKLTGVVNLFKLGVFGSDEYIRFKKGSMEFEVNRKKGRLDNPVMKVGIKSAMAFDDAVKVFDLRVKQ